MLHDPAIQMRHEAMFFCQWKKRAWRHHAIFLSLKPNQNFIMPGITSASGKGGYQLAKQMEFVLFDCRHNPVDRILLSAHLFGEGMNEHILFRLPILGAYRGNGIPDGLGAVSNVTGRDVESGNFAILRKLREVFNGKGVDRRMRSTGL